MGFDWNRQCTTETRLVCGISGWSLIDSGRRSSSDLVAMRSKLMHRGPDDSGLFENPECHVALAHNRLSIIDLSENGHQPMVNPDTGDVLVFNGEIYNFKILRTTLTSAGYRFRSESDTEVLLYAFQHWGSDCVNKLRGMFVFAVWSSRQASLFLARDPMGIKPLYYWKAADGIVFASEVKAFLCLADFKRETDRTALQQFLEFGYTLGERTIFKDVFKVLPGTWMCLKKGQVTQTETFFVPAVREPGQTVLQADRVQQAYETLDTVVADHLVADVPVGILLSGGLDSGLIAALAARHTHVQTFTMGFADSAVDERPYGRQVSNAIGSEHAELEIRPEEILEGLEETSWIFDDLFADWGTLSTRLLYSKCRERGIKVVIVGEGADELFGGYGVFGLALPGVLRGPQLWKMFQLYRHYIGRRHGRCFAEFSRIFGNYLEDTGDDWFAAIRLFETRQQLPSNYMMKVDKASMSVSVEARVPYLDQRVAELAYATPSEFLIDRGGGKRLLKEVARRYKLLPEDIIDRPKFGAPLAVSWMDESAAFRAYARQIILDPAGWAGRLGLRKAMTAYFDRGRSGYPFPHVVGIFRNLAWRLLLLNLWSQKYLSPNA